MAEVRIAPLRRELAPAFQRLNLDWIERLGIRHAADPDPPECARADVYMELPTGWPGS